MLRTMLATHRAHVHVYLTTSADERLTVKLEESTQFCLPQQVLTLIRGHNVHPDLLENHLEFLLVPCTAQ